MHTHDLPLLIHALCTITLASVPGCSAQSDEEAAPDANTVSIEAEITNASTFKIDQAAAKAGDKEAQFRLGVACLENGDFNKGTNWLLKAAENGNVDAMLKMGHWYRSIKGGKQDLNEAAKWLKRAAEGGNAIGQNDYGAMVDNGHGVAQNYDEAFKWYERSAKQGFALGMHNLGLKIIAGHGTNRNSTIAKEWFERAAELGHVDSIHALGRIFELGEGVKPDLSKAIELYRQAATNGLNEAQNSLGAALLQADPENHREAQQWLEIAAEAGNISAHHNLGLMYENGTGVEKNSAAALKHYEVAAKKGYAPSQNNLAKFYFEFGKHTEAVRLLRSAANQGNSDAQAALGGLLLQGIGTKRNVIEAYKWTILAVRQKNAIATQQIMPILQETLTQNQIQAGTRKADEFRGPPKRFW